jgi:hypothetical protein
LRTLLVLLLLATSARGAAQGPVPAVWKEHVIFFSYRSSTATYSCSTLRNRVGAILVAVGARPDLEIALNNCNASFVPADVPATDRGRWTLESGTAPAYDRHTDREQIVDVRVRLSMPVEVTPDVIDELKADKSRRELISQATGNPIPRFDDPIPFAAERQLVTLSHRTAGLDAGDCELLEELVDSSFRSLGLRVVRRGFACDHGGTWRIPPSLDVEALVATPIEGSPSRPMPAGDEKDRDPAVPAAPVEQPAAPATGPTTQ